MMRHLAEALKNLSKYPDRPIVDYWRTVQGTNVGFHGDPKAGAGIPIAGPPVLTGGSASGNPLLEPLLKKYPKKTFIGDAIRKKNFPLTVVNFIENFVGKDEAAIKARFAEMEKRAAVFAFSKEEIARAEKERTDALNKFVGTNIDLGNGDMVYLPYANHWNNPVVFSKQNGKFVNSLPENKEVQDYVDYLNKRGIGIPKPTENAKAKDIDPETYSEVYQNLLSKGGRPPKMLRDHFDDPAGNASYLYKIMQLEGVAGTFSGSDYVATTKISTKEEMDEYLKSNKDTDYEKCKQFLGDVYVLNQILMRARGKKTQTVTRGMGDTIAGLGNNLESQKVVAEMVQNGVSMRFLNRPVSGFADGKTSGFRGWTLTSDIPAEAILSSTLGTKVQNKQFENEKEVLIIGAATLPFSPDQISYSSLSFSGDKFSSEKIALKVKNGNTTSLY